MTITSLTILADGLPVSFSGRPSHEAVWNAKVCHNLQRLGHVVTITGRDEMGATKPMEWWFTGLEEQEQLLQCIEHYDAEEIKRHVHSFNTCEDAYTACMCQDQQWCDVMNDDSDPDAEVFFPVNTGDTFIIESDQVVGLATTWPLAVTKKHAPDDHPTGGIHTMGDGYTVYGMRHSLDEGDTGPYEFTEEQIQRAVGIANGQDWPVAEYIGAPQDRITDQAMIDPEANR